MRSSVTFGSFEFDPYSRLLKRDGVELSLPPRVLGVLEVLLHRAGDVVPRQELIDNVWKDAFVTDTSLAEAVSQLRQALGDDPQSPSFIQTFHRRGYRFVAPVAVLGQASVAVAKTVEPERPSFDGPSIGRQLAPWSVAVASLILAGVAVWQAVSKGEPPARPITRFAVAPPAGTRFDSRAPAFALSPDGSRLAFSACNDDACRLYVRPSDHLDAFPLAGTDEAAAPFFSPDGRWIGFFADGHLKKVSVSGGAPVTLAEAADPLGAAWTANGHIIFAGAAPGLRLVADTGGEPVTFTTPNPREGEVRHMRPAVVPGTRFVLLTIATGLEADSPGRISLLDLTARARPPVVLLANAVAALAPSREMIAFATGSELQVAALDVLRGHVAGAPQTAVGNVAFSRGTAQFATAVDGTSIVLTAEPTTAQRTLSWSGGEPEDAGIALDALRSAALSPDGRRVAGFSRNDAAKSDLWIGDLVTGTTSRLTHGETASSPVWNRNGGSVWFAASTGGQFAIHQREIDSLQPPRRVFAGSGHAFPTSVSPDGSVLAITVIDATTGADIWTLPAGGGHARPIIRTTFDERAATFSPNGQFLAYQSNDAGRWEIYTHRLSDHRRASVSTNGGISPFWSPDGSALFFVSGNRLMRAVIGAGGETVGTPTVWSNLDGARLIGMDGRGRLLLEGDPARAAQSAILTLQWDREIRQLLGPPSPSLPR